MAVELIAAGPAINRVVASTAIDDVITGLARVRVLVIADNGRRRPGQVDDTVIAEGPYADRKFYAVGEQIFRFGKADGSVPACAACHGPAGSGNPGSAWPSLGGQHAGYTATVLTAFRDGKVWGDGENANAIMAGVAGSLSDDEIQALASYIEGLHNAADTPSADAVAAGQPQG